MSGKSRRITRDQLAILSKKITGQYLEKNKSDFESVSELLTYLNNIIALMPGNVFWRDRSGIFLGCNDNQLEMLNLTSREEYIGKTYEDFFEPEHAAELWKTDNDIMTSDMPISKEEVAIRDGKPYAVYLVRKIPLHDDEGKVIGLLGISIDITDRKRAEAALMEKRILEQRILNMQFFGTSIAHELRTPLRTIESALSGTGKKLDKLIAGYNLAREAGLEVPFIAKDEHEDLQQAIGLIQQEIHHTFTIIEMLLVRARSAQINTDSLQLISMADIVNQALARYPFKGKEKTKINWRAENDFEFFGDHNLAIHIIFNLLKNALYYIKAARKGEITIWLEPGKKFNTLHFKDTGAGIPQNVLPKIFDPFFSLTQYGTGTGLTYCRQVMEGFKGAIICDSKEGEYTHFALTFPISSCRKRLTKE